MKYLIGWLIGVGTAWAALAIWQRVPEFPDIDAPPDEGSGEHLSNRFPPYPVIDPEAFTLHTPYQS